MSTETDVPLWHGTVTVLGGVSWVVAAGLSGYMAWLGFSDRNPTFGGRSMEALFGGAPLALALLLSTLAALAVGGFDWVLPGLRWPVLRWALVLAAMLGTTFLAAMAIGLQMAPPQGVPWVLRPLRWAWLLWLPLLLLAGALALHAGMTRLAPALVVVVGYGAAFYLLAETLKTLPVGAVYAIWSGLAMVGAALIGAILFG